MLPQWCEWFLCLPGWGLAPFTAPHTWLGGLPDLGLTPWRPAIFFDPGESLYALITPSEKRVWGHCFRGSRAIWSSCKSYNQLQTQGSQKGNEGLIRLGRASFMLIYNLSKAALEIINLLLMKWKSEQRFHSVCFFSYECSFSNHKGLVGLSNVLSLQQTCCRLEKFDL